MSGAEVVAGRFELLGPSSPAATWARSIAPSTATSGQTVAVKLMWRRRSGEEVTLTVADKNATRFAREVRIMQRLSSANLPRTIDGGLDGDRPYLAMEYIDGITLDTLLAENGQLPVTWAAAIGAQIARGLDAAHRAGVVHRDLKPSNVMLAADGVVKVLDFGVGLILDDVDGGRVTSSDATVGTARYMAPEQARQHTVTAAVDLYALGCVLFEALVGAPPGDGGGAFQVMKQHVEQPPADVRMLRGDVPEELGAVVARLLEKDPTNRPGHRRRRHRTADPGRAQGRRKPLRCFQGVGDPVPSRLRALMKEDHAEGADRQQQTAVGRPGRAVLGRCRRAVRGSRKGRGSRRIRHLHRPQAADRRIPRLHREVPSSSATTRSPSSSTRTWTRKAQWPDPWLSLNPFFANGGSVADLVGQRPAHRSARTSSRRTRPRAARAFDGAVAPLYRHQLDAIRAAQGGDSYVLTTGTGSGKSLSYIVPIVNRVLRARQEGDTAKRVRAIIVYPMNALANSQLKELEKFLRDGYGKGGEPVTFARYTGQESQADRDKIRENPPDILLTNYVMLELMLTRPDDRRSLIRMASGLEFLVFDELHTYRGRQGADVALLVRRVKDACARRTTCSASARPRPCPPRAPAQSASRSSPKWLGEIFGTSIAEDNVISETLLRATDEDAGPVTLARIAAPAAPASYADLRHDPLASWIEAAFNLGRDDEGQAGTPQADHAVQRAATDLAKQASADPKQVREGHPAHPASRLPRQEPGERPPAVRVPPAPVHLQGRHHPRDARRRRSKREVTRDYQIELPGSDGKLLYPLAFCRECGQEYLAVWRKTKDGMVTYQARRDTTIADDDADGDAADGDVPGRASYADGYLYVSSDLLWPRDRATVIADRRVPESWVEIDDRSGGETLKQSSRRHVPVAVTVDAYGMESPPRDGLEAAFIPGRFRFCLQLRRAPTETYRGQDFASQPPSTVRAAQARPR